MAAQRGSNNSAKAKNFDGPDLDDFDDLEGFGVAVVREDGKWTVTPLPTKALASLSAAETELREMRSSGAVFGLLDVDDEFFVVLRPAPSGTRLLLSDASLAGESTSPRMFSTDSTSRCRISTPMNSTTSSRGRRAIWHCSPTSDCPRP